MKTNSPPLMSNNEYGINVLKISTMFYFIQRNLKWRGVLSIQELTLCATFTMSFYLLRIYIFNTYWGNKKRSFETYISALDPLMCYVSMIKAEILKTSDHW